MTTVGILLILILALCVFLICRELFCWYWKINAIVDKLDKIVASLGNIETHLLPRPQYIHKITDEEKTKQIKMADEAMKES